MAAKAMELGWSPKQSAKESGDAIDNPSFVYVKLERIWPKWKKGKAGNDGGFIVRWGAEKVGFGELSFYLKKGKLYCDTECMGTKFPKAVMAALMESVEYVQR